MDITMITIALFMYNEEKYILDALESIRFQVENYADGKEVQLILLDDCSKDRTTQFADMWLEEHAALFQRVDKLYGEKNVGTCRKYRDMIAYVRGDKCVTVAGDDMFGAQNLFRGLEMCDQDIVMMPVFSFKNYKINTGIGEYLNIIAQSLTTAKSIRWEAKLGSPVLNGAIYNLKRVSEEVLAYMCQYRLVEDRSRVYKMVMENPELTVKYVNMPLMLYRRHEDSVSGLQSPHLKVHNDDIQRLFQDIYDHEKNVFLRWAIKRQQRAVRYRGKKGVKAKLIKLTPYYFVIGMRFLLHWFPVRNRYDELMSKYAAENNRHLKKMHAAAIEFGARHGIELEKE